MSVNAPLVSIGFPTKGIRRVWCGGAFVFLIPWYQSVKVVWPNIPKAMDLFVKEQHQL